MSICQICLKNPADATGSHILPASLLKECIGKRDKEGIYKFDSKSPGIKAHHGRDNPFSKEGTENEFVRDYIYCNICEKALSKIESSFFFEIIEKIGKAKYRGNFKIIEYDEANLFFPLRYDYKEFWAYIISLVFRFCRDKLVENIKYIKEEDLEELRKLLNEYLTTDNISEQTEASFSMKFCIMASDSIPDGSLLSVIGSPPGNPVYFKFCELLIFVYSNSLPIEGGVNKFPQSNFKQPFIILFPENKWQGLAKNLNKAEINAMVKEAIKNIAIEYSIPIDCVKRYYLEYYYNKSIEEIRGNDQVLEYILTKCKNK